MLKTTGSMILAALLVAAPVHAQALEGHLPRLPSVTLPAELDRVLRDYEARWAAGGGPELAALFTEDGFVADRGGWIRGRAGIAEKHGATGGPLVLRAVAFDTAGDVGWMVGAYGYGEMAEQFDSGKFVLALKRDAEGVWRIAADLDATNMRPPGS